MKNNKIIVSICSRKYNINLLKLLENLEKNQRYKKLNIEIFILFNSLKKLNKDQFKKIQIILKGIHFNVNYEKKIGVSFARNSVLKFLSNKKFRYGCFLDDDCFIKKNFLISHLNFIKKHNCEIVGGPQIYDSQNSHFKIFERKIAHSADVNWVSTNNVFFKKEILKKKIKFSNEVSIYGYGEDQLYFNQLSKIGLKIKWNANPVFENVSKKMDNILWFCKRNFNYGLTGVLIDMKIYKRLIFLLVCLIKINLYLFKSFFYFLLIPLNPKTYFYFSFGFLIRFFGRILGLKNIRKIL